MGGVKDDKVTLMLEAKSCIASEASEEKHGRMKTRMGDKER